MLVSKWMTRDPHRVQSTDTISHAIHVMKDNDIRHLPVLDGDRLAGIVTDRDLKEFTPSKATALDVYEMHYLLTKATVTEAMHKNPMVLLPGDTIEKAARIMHDEKIGCLPVVENDRLVGIVTQEDVFGALVAVTGCRAETTRLQMTIPDAPGSIKDVADRVRAHGLKLRSILTTYQDVAGGQRELILRVEGEATSLERELQDLYDDLVVHRGC